MPIFDSANIARHLPLMALRSNHPALISAILTLLIASLLLLTSCARYFTPNINLDRYATREEIVGTWHMLSSTLDLARRAGYQPTVSSVHAIDFRADGTCDFNSIMETTEGIIHFNAAGTWKLEHDTQRNGQRECKNQLELSVARHGFSLGLTEENGKILLWEFLGDPDSWEFIKYEKRS